MIRHKKTRVERVKSVALAVLKKPCKRYKRSYYLESELPECEDIEVEFSRRYSSRTDSSIKSDRIKAVSTGHREPSADSDRFFRERLLSAMEKASTSPIRLKKGNDIYVLTNAADYCEKLEFIGNLQKSLMSTLSMLEENDKAAA